MGSNLSKRKSASQGALDPPESSTVPPHSKYKLCSSLPNHLDMGDNNNEAKSAPLPFPACPLHHADLIACYPFITPDRVFSVVVSKGSGGLGLSVVGGEPYPGLVRIKRLFPHQPAAECRQLHQGDILLAAANVPLLGLSNYEALEVLRTTPQQVKLTVCRPPEGCEDQSTPALPPPPPPRDLLASTPRLPLEFEIVMEKSGGSLGFTLRKEDDSALGHYVRALVREPALSDPRIKPGDKIIAVNEVEMSPMSHEEAVTFLRQCGTEVRLRLYRDPVQTPLPAHSPTGVTPSTTLRKEAVDMLSELASRKCQSPQDSSSSSSSSSKHKGSSPRKRRLTRTPPLQNCADEPVDDGELTPRFPSALTSPMVPGLHSFEEDCRDGPASMPALPADQSFSHSNPAYRSTHPTLPPSHEQRETEEKGAVGLLKWKGVLFTQDSQAGRPQVVEVEMNRGWNSRLGFSLQPGPNNTSVISAVHPDSVAWRDGRLRIGDTLINVNDEKIEGLSTTQVIDLLRKIRGSICLTLLRHPQLQQP